MIKGALSDRMQRLTQERTPFVVATVVRARRPTSVRPGDSAVVLADGTVEGFVGGVCAESSVRLYSLRALETGEAVLLRLVPGEGTDGDGDDGIDGAVVEHNPCLSGGALEIFLEPQLPAARVAVVGSSPIAGALARVASAAGYDVASGLARAGRRGRGGRRLARLERGGCARRRAPAGVPYVALVASSKRGEAVRESLDIPTELRAQLHTPAGLDLGGSNPRGGRDLDPRPVRRRVPHASGGWRNRPPPPPTRSAGCRSPSPARRRSSTSTASGCTSAPAAAVTRTPPGMRPAEDYVTGLVLAAGGSKRLGQPKQLLPFGTGTLLDHVLGVARECPFDQLLCVVNAELPGVDLAGFDVVENPRFGEGCSSSIAAALGAVDARAGVLVLMLGDQPGVRASSVAALLAGARRCAARRVRV